MLSGMLRVGLVGWSSPSEEGPQGCLDLAYLGSLVLDGSFPMHDLSIKKILLCTAPFVLLGKWSAISVRVRFPRLYNSARCSNSFSDQ
jgi:hypothetical protein